MAKKGSNGGWGSVTRMRYKDTEFYMSLITFEVQDILFRVPIEAFQTRSKVFRDMFLLPVGEEMMTEGRSDDAPIMLAGIDAEDFRALLRFLYPRKFGSTAELSQKEWISILALAHMWGFREAREASKASLDNLEDAITKFELASRYDYHDWLRDAYKKLANRSSPLSEDEAIRIGAAAASRISRLREIRLKAQLTNQVCHTNARVRVHPGRRYDYDFRCCLCSNVVKQGYDATTCKETFKCDFCGVEYHWDRKTVEDIIASKIEAEIQNLVPDRPKPQEPDSPISDAPSHPPSPWHFGVADAKVDESLPAKEESVTVMDDSVYVEEKPATGLPEDKQDVAYELEDAEENDRKEHLEPTPAVAEAKPAAEDVSWKVDEAARKDGDGGCKPPVFESFWPSSSAQGVEKKSEDSDGESEYARFSNLGPAPREWGPNYETDNA